MVYLIDTNVVIRFLTADHPEQFETAKKIFTDIEEGAVEAKLLPPVLMEAFFVLTKFYGLPRNEVLQDLRTLLSMPGIVNDDKVTLSETLTRMAFKRIDFVDALLCAKRSVEGYGIFSFDDDVKKCDPVS